MGYCVYILFSSRINRFYVGMTEDIDKRLIHHNHPIDPAKFTAKGIPWELFFTILCESKRQALKLERLIKAKKSKIFIEKLPLNPDWVQELLTQASDG